jgi:hypothetical protein
MTATRRSNPNPHRALRVAMFSLAAWLGGGACTADLVQMQEASCSDVGEQLSECVKSEDVGPRPQDPAVFGFDVGSLLSAGCESLGLGQECRNCLTAYDCGDVASECEDACGRRIEPSTLSGNVGAGALCSSAATGSSCCEPSNPCGYDNDGACECSGCSWDARDCGSSPMEGSVGSRCSSHDDCESGCCNPPFGNAEGECAASSSCFSCTSPDHCDSACCVDNKCAPLSACGI